MSNDVKWIKITTDMFDDEKIRLIEKMPDGDAILVIFIKLLTLAGRVNHDGFILLTEDIPYTEEMLSTIFDKPLQTVKLALGTFLQFGMIHYANDIMVITNWNKHQNTEGLERIRAQTRAAVARYRERLQLVGGESYREHSGFVMSRDGHRCVYCGSEENLVIDHLIPLLLGGDNNPDNLTTACRRCNSGKAGRLFEQTGYKFLNPDACLQYEKVKERLGVGIPLGVTSRNLSSLTLIPSSRSKSIKKNYGSFDNVLLTDDEYQKLKAKFNPLILPSLIEALSIGIESKGYKYRSHYATILNWARREDGKNGAGTTKQNPRQLTKEYTPDTD